MGASVHSWLPDGTGYTTRGLSITCLRPATGGGVGEQPTGAVGNRGGGTGATAADMHSGAFAADASCVEGRNLLA